MNCPHGTTHVRKLVEFGEGFEYWMQQYTGWKVYNTHHCEWEVAIPKSWCMPWSINEYKNSDVARFIKDVKGYVGERCPKVLKDTPVCGTCNGTGIESYYNHGYGEDSIEPIKCEKCDGFGRIQEGLGK